MNRLHVYLPVMGATACMAANMHSKNGFVCQGHSYLQLNSFQLSIPYAPTCMLSLCDEPPST